MAGKQWTGKEIAYIKRYAILAETNAVLNVEEIAKKLGRSEGAIKSKVYALRLEGVLPECDFTMSFDNYRRPYTGADDKRIIDLLKRWHTHQEIADILGRNRSSITNRIYVLRKKGKLNGIGYKKWTDDEIEKLISTVKFDYTGHVSNYDELTKLLHMTKRVIMYQVTKLKAADVIDIPVTESMNVNLKNRFGAMNAHDCGKNYFAKDPFSIGGTQLIHVFVTKKEDGVHEYRLQNGELLTVKKLTPPGSKISQ